MAGMKPSRSALLPMVLGFAVLANVDADAVDPPTPPSTANVAATAESTLVEVPVHVTGKDGLPVRGLGRDDFELFDEGRRVPIQELEIIDLDQPAGPAKPVPPPARRHFLLLFDLSFSSPINLTKARGAARDFVQKSMRRGDLGSVATFDAERGLKLVLSFTPDTGELARAVEATSLQGAPPRPADSLGLALANPAVTAPADALQSSGAPASEERIGATEAAERQRDLSRASGRNNEDLERARVSQMIKALSDLARTLNSVRGRKHVIFFSEGFDSKLLTGATGAEAGRTDADQVVTGQIRNVRNEERFGSNALRTSYQDLLKLFLRSDCAVHPVDIAGLTGRFAEAEITAPHGEAVRALGRGQDSLFTMAEGTGGTLLKNSNDFSEQLDRLQRQTSLVYVLSFLPQGFKEPGRFRSLKVKTRAANVRVSFRTGYYEPRPFAALSPVERRLSTAEFIAYGLPRAEIAAMSRS